jgi:hypothetical protein
MAPEGAANKAATFNGGSTSAVTATGPVDFDTTSPFSIEAWIKTTDNSTSYQSVVSKIAGGAGYQLGVLQGGYLRVELHDASGQHYLTEKTGGGSNLADGNWHYVAMTYNGNQSHDGLNLYIDGNERTDIYNMGGGGSGSTLHNTEPLRIGSNGLGYQHFAGAIDEAAVYAGELSAAAIASHFYAKSSSVGCYSYPTAVLADTPVGYWRLGEDGGTTVYNSAATCSAQSGTAGAGVTLGGTAFATLPPAPTEAANKAATFSGGSTSVVTVADSSPFNFDASNPFSIEAWVKTTDNSAFQPIVSKIGSNGAGYQFGVYNGSAFKVDLLESGGAYYLSEQTWAVCMNDGNWHYVAATYDGSGTHDGLKMYVDGTERSDGYPMGDHAGSILNDGTLRIGANNLGYQHFTGAIDEAAVYATELSAAAIANHYHATPPTPVCGFPNYDFINKVEGSSFEGQYLSPHWTVATGSSLSLLYGDAWSDGRLRTGRYSLDIEAGTSELYQTVTGLLPSHWYRFYCPVSGKGTSLTSATVTYGVRNYGDLTVERTADIGNALSTYRDVTSNPETWTTNWLSFKTGPSSTTAEIYVHVVSSASAADGIYLDDLGVQLGGADGTGLIGQYYNGESFNTLVFARQDATIDFRNWGTGSPSSDPFCPSGTSWPTMNADSFSVRWTGQVMPLYSETYTFYTYADNGAQLWVNGQLISDHWTASGEFASTAIALTAGYKYDIRLDYHETTGTAAAILKWSSASQPKEVIPASQLYTGPLGWWKLDEVSGNATDATGRSQTGTVANGPFWSSAGGILNGAMTFYAVDSYVSVQSPANSLLKYTGGEMTLSTWVYVSPAETTGADLISKPWNTATGQYNYCLRLESGRTVSVYLQGNNATPLSVTSGAMTLATGTWNHVATTFDSLGNVKLYVNGELVGSGNYTGPITGWAPSGGDTNQPLVLGSKYPRAGSYAADTLDGKLDDVRVYGQALSAEAIAELARGAAAFWKLDETSGTTAIDSSGNGYGGTLTNGPTWHSSGKYNGSLSFDGSNDYVSVPYAYTGSSDTALEYARSEVPIKHTGQTNPTAESPAWSLMGSGTCSGSSSDGGYWQIQSSSNVCYYWYSLTPLNLASDWSVTGRLKATTISTSSAWSASIWVHDGTTMYQIGLRGGTGPGLYYRNSSNGETQLYSFTPSTSTYYELKLVKSGGTVQAYLDGAYRGTLSNPYLNPTAARVCFGDQNNVDNATTVRWNSVQFAVAMPKGLTLNTWVYIDPNETTGGYLISKDWTSSQTNYRLSLGADRKVSFTLGDGASTTSITSTAAISTAAWHHVAATVDPAGSMNLYVDGVSAATPGTFTSVKLDAVNNTALTLGGSSAGTAATCFQGKVDQVRIYETALSSADIGKLANGSILPPPLRVQSIVVNGGDAQRSKLSSVAVTFSGIVAVDDGAFEVLKTGTGGGLVNVLVTMALLNGRSVATLTFDGVRTEYGSLTDGEYQLKVRSDRIHSADGHIALDGDDDGRAGGDRLFGNRLTDALFRRFGDADGDRDVDGVDLLQFRLAYGSLASYKSSFDFDGDGDTDGVDLFRFRQRFGV